MKKRLNQLIISILVLLCLATNTCYADTKNETIYVSLGDSIADGIGLPANPLRGPEQENKALIYCNKTEGAYPVLLAKELGIADENFYQLACGGMRSVELRYCLDQNYVMPNKYANNFQGNELQEWVLDRFDYTDLVSKADIITLNICANDIATNALFAVRFAMIENGVSDETLDCLIENDLESGEINSALAKLLIYAEKFEYYDNIVTAAIQGLTDGYVQWTENWDAICKRIYELNPDVKLVCLGMYNPFNETKLTDSSLLKIGTAFDGIVAAINSWALAGSSYADKYTYVSIMGIESMFAEQGMNFTDDDFLNGLELNVHPSKEGQSQIADRVLKTIKTANLLPEPLKSVVNSGKNTIGKTSRKVTKLVSKIGSLFR